MMVKVHPVAEPSEGLTRAATSARYKDFEDSVNRWDAGVSAAPRPTWLSLQGKGNRDTPVENWAMTLRQLNRIIDAFDATSTFWQLKARDDPRKKGRYVNLYDLNKHFVIPWTKGTGNSIALLMNAECPLTAQLMISHAWAEDVEEFLVALNSFFREHSIDRNLPIWVCTFAQYQANDGPTVAEQVAREPFKTVIQSLSVRTHGMCVVHTTRCEVYERLWCAHEIDEALSLHLQVRPAISPEYMSDGIIQTMSNTRGLNTENAKCGCPEDEETIKNIVIDKQGGFKRLDEVVTDFRLGKVVSKFCTFDSVKYVAKQVDRVADGSGSKIVNDLANLANQNEQTEHGEHVQETTPLISAAKAGQAERVKELIAAGVDVNARDNMEWTALMHAGKCGDLACVQALITAGADVQAEDKTGLTALMVSAAPETGASRGEALRKTEAILGAGADVNAQSTKSGRTALMGATCSDNPTIVQVLLAAKADVTMKDSEKEMTALDMAQEINDNKCRKILEEAAPTFPQSLPQP